MHREGSGFYQSSMRRDPEQLDGDDEASRILQSLHAVYDPAQKPADGAPITLPANALAAAGFDRDGRLCTDDARFGGWFDADEVMEAAADWLRGDRSSALVRVGARDGSTTVVLLGTVAAAGSWALPSGAAEALAAQSAAVVALAYRPFAERDVAEAALASWRLTPLEARTVHALVSAGDLRTGAKQSGINYETARKALKLALRKANAQRQTDLVRLLHTAVGGGDVQPGQAPALRQALGLTERAAGASVLLALGLTRGETAATLHVSEHAIKDELNALFHRFGLRTATDLSRMTTEALVLLGVAGNPNLTLGASWSALRPLRFVSRRDAPGRIAMSDFGPASGFPTLLFHSATTGSLLDRGLVQALQAAGMRPIAVERPGFGLTDPPEDDPLEAAVTDVLTLMNALGLKRVRLVCRGGEATALELGRRAPERIDRGVLINPFTPYALDSRWDGFMNRGKRLVSAYPEMIEPLANFLTRRSTPKAVERLVRNALRESPADVAAMNDPQIAEDYVESARLTALRSSWGFVHDQRAYLDWTPPSLPDGGAWVRLVGEQDVLYRPGDGDSLWTIALPGHRTVRASDAGRLLHASHPHLVVQALTD